MGSRGSSSVQETIDQMRLSNIYICTSASTCSKEHTSSRMTIEETLLERHETEVNDFAARLLNKVAEGGDISNDTNIQRVQEVNKAMMKQYHLKCLEAFEEMKRVEPSRIRQISLNKTKRDRAEKAKLAIEEREEKKIELLRKMKSLRKHVPTGIRNDFRDGN